MVTLYGTLLRILASVTTCYTLCFIGYFAFNLNQSSLTRLDKSCSSSKKGILVDVALICLFILQHSCLRYIKVQNKAITRILYCFSSTFCLHVVYTYWNVHCTLYQTELATSTIQVLHCVGWLWIASSLILVDPFEVFGFKHIWNEEADKEDPLLYKREGARRLAYHYRHPIFVGPILLMCTCKTITLDKVLLIVVFVIYTIITTDIDYFDYLYLRYVPYTLRTQHYSKVEIRSKAMVTKEIHQTVILTDEDEEYQSDSGCDVSGNNNTPTHHKPEYYRAITPSQTPKSEVVIETSTSITTSKRRKKQEFITSTPIVCNGDSGKRFTRRKHIA